MQISELELSHNEQSLASQALKAATRCQQQLALVVSFDDETEQARWQTLAHQFDLVTTPGQALVPQAALTPLIAALEARHFTAAAADLTAIQAAHAVRWQAGRFVFDVSAKPLVYGILNVSPESFYDGGRFVASADMQAHVAQMVQAGVDVLEVGGQTTRPGFTPLTAEVEWQRVAPVIDWVQAHYPDLPLAIDTYKYPLMQQALACGVDIINDVNGFTDDPAKLALLAQSNCGLLTMHSNRTGEYLDLTQEMRHFFKTNLADLTQAGIAYERIALDQGIGYAKVADGQQDYAMMRNIEQLNDFKRPLMVAISRKGFGAQLFGLAKDDRLPVTLVAEAAMFLKGGNILRVHDVVETMQLRKMLTVIQSTYWAPLG